MGWNLESFWENPIDDDVEERVILPGEEILRNIEYGTGENSTSPTVDSRNRAYVEQVLTNCAIRLDRLFHYSQGNSSNSNNDDELIESLENDALLESSGQAASNTGSQSQVSSDQSGSRTRFGDRFRIVTVSSSISLFTSPISSPESKSDSDQPAPSSRDENAEGDETTDLKQNRPTDVALFDPVPIGSADRVFNIEYETREKSTSSTVENKNLAYVNYVLTECAMRLGELFHSSQNSSNEEGDGSELMESMENYTLLESSGQVARNIRLQKKDTPDESESLTESADSFRFVSVSSSISVFQSPISNPEIKSDSDQPAPSSRDDNVDEGKETTDLNLNHPTEVSRIDPVPVGSADRVYNMECETGENSIPLTVENRNQVCVDHEVTNCGGRFDEPFHFQNNFSNMDKKDNGKPIESMENDELLRSSVQVTGNIGLQSQVTSDDLISRTRFIDRFRIVKESSSISSSSDEPVSRTKHRNRLRMVRDRSSISSSSDEPVSRTRFRDKLRIVRDRSSITLSSSNSDLGSRTKSHLPALSSGDPIVDVSRSRSADFQLNHPMDVPRIDQVPLGLTYGVCDEPQNLEPVVRANGLVKIKPGRSARSCSPKMSLQNQTVSQARRPYIPRIRNVMWTVCISLIIVFAIVVYEWRKCLPEESSNCAPLFVSVMILYIAISVVLFYLCLPILDFRFGLR